jgi:hypothetical protein
MVVTGGNTRVDRLEIDSANDYLDVSTDLQVISAADITLNPGGNNVKPGGDSQDDLGVDGTAWRKLFVDDIDLNGQGRIDLDADADTSVRSSADDVITFEAGAADIAQMTSTMAISGSSASTGSFGYLNVDGDTVIGGNITLGDAATDAISISADLTSHLIPNADNTYDLGSGDQSWRHIYAEGNVSSSVSSTGSFGYLNVDGDTVIGGNLTFGDAATDSVSFSAEITSNIVPDADSTYDLGSSTKFWKDVYIDSLTATGNVSSSVSSTGSFGKVVAAGVLNATTLQQGGVIVPTGTAISASFVEKGAVSASFAQKTGVSGSFAQKSAVSSSFAQKSGVSGSFILQSALSGSSTVISGSAASTGSFGQLEVAGDVAIEGATANTLLDIDSDSVSHIVHVAGNGATQLSGSLKVTGSIGTSGNVTPSADNSIDLGAASYRWANVYTADLHLNNEGNPNTVDGTTGNWTVQEGEDYIYIVNNKSNKKFKLMLEEIE